ncbi:hypothetical protein BGZ49_005483, partial [Haplosporangium sp. Z 27]
MSRGPSSSSTSSTSSSATFHDSHYLNGNGTSNGMFTGMPMMMSGSMSSGSNQSAVDMDQGPGTAAIEK